jgi:hypothetical protein
VRGEDGGLARAGALGDLVAVGFDGAAGGLARLVEATELNVGRFRCAVRRGTAVRRELSCWADGYAG